MVAFSGEQTTAISPARLAHVNIKFLHAVRPPASIKIHSQLIRHMAGLYIFDVQARVDGVVMAEGAVVLSAQSDRNHQEVPE
jgi:3-hydroxymyristoyl/3-hydroxydecanoyl-(acyl carrier protein) dehydratase